MNTLQTYCDTFEEFDRKHFIRFIQDLSKNKSYYFNIVEIPNVKIDGKVKHNIDIQMSAMTFNHEIKQTYDVELKTNLGITSLNSKLTPQLDYSKFKTLETFSDNHTKLFVHLCPNINKILLLDITDIPYDELFQYYKEKEITHPYSNKKEIRKSFYIPITNFKQYDYDFTD